MTNKWDKTSLLRSSINAASTVTGAGFSTVKAGTKLGVGSRFIIVKRTDVMLRSQFSITRGITSTAAGITGYAVDQILFGGKLGAGQVLRNAVSSAVTFAEKLTLLPILVGESITSTSLVAAHSTVNALSIFFPGSDEASFSLASFVTVIILSPTALIY
jgi:sn1-specific diacylglycerol lipase